MAAPFSHQTHNLCIGKTTEALKAINPLYIVPTHCTGRKASMHIEREMQEKFLLNRSGTKMVFAAGDFN